MQEKQKENFEHRLIKGRIGETIFELMFRETKRFEVLHFGYEYTEPALAQYRKINKTAIVQKVIDQVSKAPDFILVENPDKNVFLVEVKCRKKLNGDYKDIVKIAERYKGQYPISYIFFITEDKFYFATVNDIVKNKSIENFELKDSWVPKNIQDKYKGFVNEFLWSKTT